MTTIEHAAQGARKLGFNEGDSERLAVGAYELERNRLQKLDPKALADTERKIQKAQSELDTAQAALEQRRQQIAGLENSIIALGKHRELIAAFDAEFGFAESSEAAGAIFSAWQRSITDPCPANSSAYGNLVQDFIVGVALRPHVNAHREQLKEQEAAMVDAILETGKRERIDIQNLLKCMRSEAGVNPKTRQLGSADRWRIFSAGLLDDLAKN